MALTKIGASLGGGADTIDIAQAGHGLYLGYPVKMTTSGYVHATADAEANADAVGIVIETDRTGDNAKFRLALSGRVTVDGCVPNLAAGTVLYLHTSADVLTNQEPSGNNEVSKPMAIITVQNSEMILINYRGEVISTAGVAIADDSIAEVKLDISNGPQNGYYLQTNGSGVLTWAAVTSGPSQANQAAIEAETDQDTYVPPDLIRHSPGVAKCRWHGNTNVSTITSDETYNLDSSGTNAFTDHGVGDYTFFWDVDFSNATYSVVGMAGHIESNRMGITCNQADTDATARAAGSIRIWLTYNHYPNSVAIDCNEVDILAFGEQV